MDRPVVHAVQFVNLTDGRVHVKITDDDRTFEMALAPDDLATDRAFRDATGCELSWEGWTTVREGVLPCIPPRLFRRFSAEMLSRMEFPEVRFVIPDLVPEGVAVLAGKPKIGKSWWAMTQAIDVAAEGKVLYLALEDPPRRLQSRLRTLLRGDDAPSLLDFETDWPRLDKGGIEKMDAWLEKHDPWARMIVVDTIAKVRPERKQNEDQYLGDYGVWGRLQALTIAHPGVAILGVHHQRKTESDDVLDTVLGSQGVTGSVDTILVLQKSRGQADGELYVTGRDVEETERALRFEHGRWTDIGLAEDYRISQERDELIQLLREDGPLTIAEIARDLGKKYDTVKKLVYRAHDDGRVVREGKKYKVSPSHPLSPVSPESPESPEGNGTHPNPHVPVDVPIESAGLPAGTPNGDSGDSTSQGHGLYAAATVTDES
jgi:AAA domain